MKFEPNKVSKIIEQNYSHLMPDFFRMQTEYLASLNIIYHDLDASLIAMVLTSELYKKIINQNNSTEKISLKYFYQDNNKIPISTFKIKQISSILNLPRETVRRKREKLIKDKLIILDKKEKLYSLNTGMVQKKIIEVQIDNFSRFLSKFSFFFSKNKFFIKNVSHEEIKEDVEAKFLLYLTNFLDFQISYFSKMKTLLDIESIFILLLCSLNTTSQIKNIGEPLKSKDIFFMNFQILNKTLGLNATSIAEITKVPRTTVLRKISHLEKIGMLKKDKFKRYASDDLSNSNESKKIFATMDDNISLLSVFFSQCLETYSSKQ